MVEIRLAAVRVELPSNTPVLLLEEVEGQGRTLPIFIGSPEATAVAYALQGTEPPRPFTHDLLLHALDAVGSGVEKVVITELRDSTYYAELHLTSQGQAGTQVVSARPSDAVNLAVRAGCPIFCSDELIEAEGVVLASDAEEGASERDPSDDEELVDEFKDFLDQIRPQDFEQ